MKLRIVKASGESVVVTEVAGVEILDSGPLVILRADAGLPREAEFRFQLGFGGSVDIHDRAVKWPFPQQLRG
jgi:hypothetical protein